jgi:hypothetical protein
MAGKIPDVSEWLKSIDGRLGKINKKMNLSLWPTILAPVGFSVFLAGWVGVVEVLIKSNPNIPACCWYLFFAIVMIIGLALVAVPFVVWQCNSRTEKK